jgi:hypothetical protein
LQDLEKTIRGQSVETTEAIVREISNIYIDHFLKSKKVIFKIKDRSVLLAA